jgi:uncharacterized repeat protein (TIGR01451 family)
VKSNRWWALVLAVICSTLVVVPPGFASPVSAQATSPTPGLSLTKGGPDDVLAGDPVAFTLTASNAGPAPVYNASFRDVLPLGVTYAGPTTPAPPAGPGEPTVFTNRVESPAGSGNLVDQQTLVWSNVADIQATDSISLSFDVNLNETPTLGLPTYVVGSTVSNAAEAYGSSDARIVPTFSPQGAPGGGGLPVANAAVGTATASSGTTSLTAIEITKSEPSTEGELLRGVHDFTTVYTLTVDVTDTGPVEDVTVTDYLPASIEFLGCGGTDNGVGDPLTGGPVDEYPGSGPLGGANAGPDCRVPLSVETVEIPSGSTSAAGVYTKVTWALPTLTAGVGGNAPYVITYAAGVPMFENTLDFVDANGDPLPTPPPASGLQGSNLDNNNGPSTRELEAERAATNVATAAGTFDGPMAPGASADVESEDRLTRSIEDVRMIKSASTSTFDTGNRVEYELTVDVSEYVDASGLQLGDRIPNGLCPIAAATSYVPGDPVCVPDPTAGPDVVITDALGVTGTPTALAYSSVAEVDGAFDVAFTPITSLTAGESATVSYSAGMRTTYGGTQSGPPTVSGDAFTNTADLTATTDVIEDSPETAGPIVVEDGSQATIGTTGPTLRKLLLPRSVRLDPLDSTPCPTDPALYVDPSGETDPSVQFRLGDNVCFLLEVRFSTTAQTRNADVGDFLPVGVDYVDGSMTPATGNTIPPDQLGFTTTDPRAPIGWLLGAPAGANRFVAKGAVFQVVLAGEVETAPDSDDPQLKGNLMKMRTVDTAGRASSFRDDVPFRIVPPPPLRLVKGVESVDTPVAGPFDPDSDEEGQIVQQGSQVRFRIDLTNLGGPEDFNSFSARNLDVLDVLPAQVNCSAISAITNFGTNSSIGVCRDPGDSGYPIVGGTRSVIRWNFDGTDAYALFPAGEPLPVPPNGAESGTRSLFYTMTIPPSTSVSEVFTNDAGVRSFGAFTNITDGISPDYFPEDNIDPNVPLTAINAPAARDTSFVETADAVVGKFVTSWIEETDNNRSAPAPTTSGEIVGTIAQAVVGEYVTYRYFVDIPARTTVFNGELNDQLPTPDNGEFVIVPNPPVASGAPAGAGRFYGVAGAGSPTALPPGVDFVPATGTIDFGAAYTNDTATTQRFEAIVSALVVDTDLGSTDQPTRRNTARFVSTATPTGPALDAVTAVADVQIRQPVPTLDKVVAGTLPGNVVQPDTTLTYELTASNQAGRPPLHDSWILDCIPAGLESVTILDPVATDIGPDAGDPTNGCAPDETYVAFFVGSIAGGESVSRSYTAVVSTQSVGDAEYVNDAELTGSSLLDGKLTPQSPDNPEERTYSSSDSVAVTVIGASLVKTVDPDTATIGEIVEFTLQATIPSNTNFYQATIFDRIPVGFEFVPGTASAACATVETPSQTCSIGLAEVLGPVDDPSTTPPTRAVAFYAGDVLTNPVERLVTLTYNARVRNLLPGNTDGGVNDPLVNTAQTRWDLIDKPDTERPTTPLYPWQAGGTSDTANVDIIEPRLTITKTTPDLTIEPGQEFTYSIVVRNIGTSTAFNSVISDTLPVGIDLVANATSPDQGGVVAGKTITWNIPSASLDPGDAVTLTYRARLAPSAGISTTPTTSFRNDARVTRYTSLSDGTDTNGREYTGPTSRVTITPRFPVLTTTKTLESPDPVYIGDSVEWQIVTRNTSPSGGARALETTITDTLPPNWSFDATTSIVRNPGNVAVSPTSFTETPDSAGDLLTWTLATLAPGQSYIVRFTATPEPGVATAPPGLPQTFSNRTTSVAKDGSGATGNATGPYTASSSDTAQIDRVDLAIDKSHTTAPVAGETFSWSIAVRNLGPSQAVGPFVVTDQIPTLPTGVTFASASGGGWTCAPASAPASPLTTGDVTCQRTNADDTLASGGQFPAITFTVRIPTDTPDGTTITNTAAVGGQRTYERPTDLANNSDTDEAIITTRADLRIVKTLTQGLVAGEQGTYRLVVTNNGPSTSRATADRPIVVTDTLPGGLDFVSAPGCTEAAGVVTCAITSELAVGDTRTIDITVDVPASALGQFRNVAVVTPEITTDPISGNNTSIVTSEVGTNADLGIVKSHTGASTPGRPTTFNLQVTNLGPSDAATVTVVDTLPAGLTYSGFTDVSGNWSCAVTTAPQFRCDLLSPSLPLRFTGVPTADRVAVQIEVDTAANLTGQTVRNTGVVSSTTPDRNSTNNASFADVTFAGVADLALTKSSSGTALPGGDVTWTIEVTNLGPSDSLNPITVTDALPAGMDRFVSVTGTAGDGWVCDPITVSAPDIRCVKGSRLAAGTSTQLTVVGSTDPTPGGPLEITNSATVTPTTDEGPGATGNNTDTDVVALVEPDVSIAKSVTDGAPQPGDEFTYTVTLANAPNTTPAYNLVVTDDVPDGVAVVAGSISNSGALAGATPAGGVAVGGIITWTLTGPLAPGASLELTYRATLAPSTSIDTTPHVNTASLDRYESLPTGGRTYVGGDATATITPRFPQLSIDKEALGDDPTYIGDEFGWRMTITNSGDGDAAVVSLVDTLPPNWTFIDGSAVVTAPGPVGTSQPAPSSAGPPAVQTLTWSDLGPLAAGQSMTVTIRTVPGTLVADAPGVGRDRAHVNTAQADAEDATGATRNADRDYGSEPATADAFIHAADVVIEKTDAVDADGDEIPAVAGRNHTWRIDVSNDGPDRAVGPFVVRDALRPLSPDPLVFVSASGTGWSCTEAAGVVSCNRVDPSDTLASGAAFEPISITVRIPADFLSSIDGSIENTATVTARTYDPNPSNNSSTVQTPVVGEADLSLVKTRGSQTVIAGESLTYFLAVTNLGPSTSRADITVTDTLPPQVRFRSAPAAPADPWDCVLVPAGAASGGTVTCTLDGDLVANGAAPQIPILVDLLPSADPDVEVVNTAVVASTGTTDPVPGNNTSENRVVPGALADLAIDKDALGPLIAGQNAVYRMRVVNNGPSDAEAMVRITDDLPTGLGFVGFADVVGSWSCNLTTAPQFTCDLTGPLAARDEVVVDVTVLVAPDAQGTIVNTASVASPTDDPFPDNNVDSDTSPFGTLADLAIDKTTEVTPVRAGENVTWNLTVTNNGPSDSQPVIEVVDRLPSTVEFVSATGVGWDCPPPAGSTNPAYSAVLSCTRAAVLQAKTPGDPGATNHIAPTITVIAKVRPDAGPGVIVNAADVVPGATDDGNPRNNFDDAVVEVIDDVDVSVVKTADPSTVRAGETTTYTLLVANAGPSTADDVVVTDVMPSGVTIETLTANGWSCPLSTPVEFRCELDSLAPSATQTITVLARVGSGVPDASVLPNTAFVDTSSSDRNPINDSARADIAVVADADLSITKVHPVDPADPIVAGGDVEFRIDVVNNGPSDAVGDGVTPAVTVEDQLPTGFTFVSARGPWDCRVRTGTDPEVVDCDYEADVLIAGGSAPSLFVTAAIASTLDAGVHDNIAIVRSATRDTDQSNNEAIDPVVVGTVADLTITKQHDADAVRIGENLVFTLQVSNIGPSEARNVVVTDAVPAGLTLVGAAGAADPSAWDCSASTTADVSCSLTEPLAAGADAEPVLVTVSVTPQAFPALANTAVVTSDTDEPDPDPNPNTSTDEVVVPALVDLAIVKTHAGSAAIGVPLVYTLEVTNRGPIADSNLVTVTDVLPSGLTPVSATSTDAAVTCDISGQTVSCERDGLAVDETFEIELTAEVLPAAHPLVVNTATVGSETDDVDPSNNTSTDPATVPPVVDLAITKTHAGAVAVGGRITYTVTVTNNGPTSDPGPVRVLDTLPGSLRPLSAASAGMACEITGQTVACQARSPLGVGASLVVTIVAEVGPAAFPSVTNAAVVTTPGCTVAAGSVVPDASCPDTDLSNNTARDVADVAPLIRLTLDKRLSNQTGVNATWTMVVTNVGSNPTIAPIRLTDDLPNGLTYVSARGEGWVCSTSGQIVGCTYAASVAPGSSTPPLDIVTLVTAAPGTEVVNVATVDGGGPDVPPSTDGGAVLAPLPLPSTGGDPLVLLRWVPLLLLMGVALWTISRRRREHQPSTA